MKKLSIIILFLTINLFFSQNIKIKEAEFAGTIVFAKTPTEPLELENIRSAFKAKKNALAFVTGNLAGRSGTKLLVNGKNSTVRIETRSEMYFIYTAEDNFSNPKDVILLFKFDNTLDDNRVTTLVDTVGVLAGDQKSYDNFIQFEAKKYGRTSYLIKVNSLPPGEYGFTLGKLSSVDKNGTAPILHMFTVVAKAN